MSNVCAAISKFARNFGDVVSLFTSYHRLASSPLPCRPSRKNCPESWNAMRSQSPAAPLFAELLRLEEPTGAPLNVVSTIQFDAPLAFHSHRSEESFRGLYGHAGSPSSAHVVWMSVSKSLQSGQYLYFPSKLPLPSIETYGTACPVALSKRRKSGRPLSGFFAHSSSEHVGRSAELSAGTTFRPGAAPPVASEAAAAESGAASRYSFHRHAVPAIFVGGATGGRRASSSGRGLALAERGGRAIERGRYDGRYDGIRTAFFARLRGLRGDGGREGDEEENDGGGDEAGHSE